MLSINIPPILSCAKIIQPRRKKSKERKVCLFYKFDVYVAVVAIGKKFLVAALLAQRQIAVTLFDFAGNGKFVQAARDGAANVSVFGFEAYLPARADALENYVASVGIEIYFLRNVDTGYLYVPVGRACIERGKQILGDKHRYSAIFSVRLDSDKIRPAPVVSQAYDKLVAFRNGNFKILLFAVEIIYAYLSVGG